MKTSTKSIIALAAIVALSILVSQQTQDLPTASQRLLTSTYTTTSTRSQNVVDLCPANLDRTTLVSASDMEASAKFRTSINAEIGIDGNTLIGTAINGSFSASITMLTNSVTKFAIFVASFAVGLILFLLLWPFLCCCCTCPYCCPSKCCQKPADEQYSKCQLYWPTITLILALLLTMGASIYGFTKVSTFGPSISNLGCSVSIFVDDLLNGNVTSSGSQFFTGLNTLSTKLNDLNGNLTFINGNFSDLTGTTPGTGVGQSKSQLAYDNVVSVRDTKVKVIPKTSAPFQIDHTYLADISASGGPSGGPNIPLFRDVLGKFDNTSTVVGLLYDVINKIATLILDTKTQATSFQSTFASVSTQLTNIQGNISTITNSISSVDNSMNSPLKIAHSTGTNGNMGLQAFYGVLIGFSFFTLLGALLTACCDKYKCRYLMYFSCIFLFLAGLIGFLVSTIFSAILPPMTWGCSFIETTISSSTGFITNLGSPLGTTTANMLSPCMPFGDGNIINSLVAGSAMDSLNNLTSVIGTLGSFNVTEYEGWLSGNLTTMMGTIRTWCRGNVVDVDGTNFNTLTSFSVSSNWASCTGTKNLNSDSWVPSNSQNSTYVVIPCQTSNGNVGDGTSCSATLTDATGTCGGCMSSEALSILQPTPATLRSALDTRYSASCTLNPKLQNVWTNYYVYKNSFYGPSDTAGSGSGILNRAEVANALIINNAASSGGVFESLETISTLFSNIKTAMTPISDLTDPKYGLLAGLNCKIFGQDFTRIQNVLCGSMFYNMYIMRYTIGISCYGVLFAMCCIVCTGVRHYKHGERKNQVGDAFAKLQHENSSQLLRTKD